MLYVFVKFINVVGEAIAFGRRAQKSVCNCAIVTKVTTHLHLPSQRLLFITLPEVRLS